MTHETRPVLVDTVLNSCCVRLQGLLDALKAAGRDLSAAHSAGASARGALQSDLDAANAAVISLKASHLQDGTLHLSRRAVESTVCIPGLLCAARYAWCAVESELRKLQTPAWVWQSSGQVPRMRQMPLNDVNRLQELSGDRHRATQAQVADLTAGKAGAEKAAARAAGEAEAAQKTADRAREAAEHARRQLAELQQEAQEAQLAFSRVRRCT